MTDQNSGSGIAFMLRALRYRNYRLFFMGQIVSLSGTWMTHIATSWLVYRLTGSALMLGIVGFVGQFPSFLVAPFAGIFVDRWNQHRLLIATQVLLMVQALTLAVLTFGGWINVPLIIALSVMQGLIVAFDMPCRHTFVVQMVDDKKDLGNAIALNSSLVNVARLIGPSIGGLIIAAAGEGWCFLIDGISYIAVILALYAMKIAPPAKKAGPNGKVMAELREGWRYAFHSKPIRSLTLLLSLVSLLGMPYMVLAPVFADKILHGGPHTLGFLMAASGCGALIGALWLATRKSVLGLGRVILFSTATFGTGLVIFSISRTLWISIPVLLFVGCGFILQLAASNTILQTIVDDDKRGRVMSLFMMAFLGTVPLGSLLAGTMAKRIGAPATVLIGGLCCVAGAAWFAKNLPELREAVHPIYRRMGILPDTTFPPEN